jgi:ABC-2 type transport system ATP-binding protein
LVRAAIGVTGQFSAVDNLLTGTENMLLMADLHHLGRREGRRRAAALLDRFDLTADAEKQVAAYSGGMRRRLDLAMTLVGEPRLIFLDEPTTGLDPQARLNIWTVIEGIRKRGKTVVLTTHYMEEAERLCDRVAVIDRGRIVALDSPRNLIAANAAGTTLEFARVPGLDVEALRKLPGVDRVVADGQVSQTTRTPEVVLHALLDPQAPWAGREGTGGDGEEEGMIRDLVVRHGTLEDVFLSLTGRSLRE